MERGRSLHIQ